MLNERAGADRSAIDALRLAAHPLKRAPEDLDPLLERIGNAHFVLLGEATHGTHEFYRARAELTRRLIEERGFDLVAVEADWPAAYRVNRYIRGITADADSEQALGDFKRFPTWMWRNSDVLDFVGWLRAHNDSLPTGGTPVGFYGLDLYALYESIEAVLNYLDQVDPELARRARSRYACFDRYQQDSQAYGYSAVSGIAPNCEREALDQLVELRRRAADLAARDGRIPEDEFFYAEQNARLIANAEHYYREMFHGRATSWNLRDRHMADTLHALREHFQRKGQAARIVVWEHNSHIGDARATEMAKVGEWNVGQLIREADHENTVLVGFTTYEGSVTAAPGWDQPPERMRVRPALPTSYEALFHATGIPRFLLLLDHPAVRFLEQIRLERAIGVVYRPESERLSHYFHSSLRRQFDAVFHHDHTRAVEPLELSERWQRGEAPETYPSGV
ncbi:MAG: erythromycin esterase family protein [Gemmatimonadota bacterium]